MAAVATPPIAASSGSFLITPSVGLMIWTLLLFGISLFILWKLAFPRISEALDRRQHAIEESIDHAERIRHDADELLAEYREVSSNFRALTEIRFKLLGFLPLAAGAALLVLQHRHAPARPGHAACVTER